MVLCFLRLIYNKHHFACAYVCFVRDTTHAHWSRCHHAAPVCLCHRRAHKLTRSHFHTPSHAHSLPHKLVPMYTHLFFACRLLGLRARAASSPSKGGVFCRCEWVVDAREGVWEVSMSVRVHQYEVLTGQWKPLQTRLSRAHAQCICIHLRLLFTLRPLPHASLATNSP